MTTLQVQYFSDFVLNDRCWDSHEALTDNAEDPIKYGQSSQEPTAGHATV